MSLMDDMLAGMAEAEGGQVEEASEGPSLADQIIANMDDSILERAEPFAAREGQTARGLGRLALKGATFGVSDIVGKSNDIEKWARGQADTQRAQTEYPVGSIAAEIVGSLPTSGGLFAAGKAVGASPALIGAVEGGAYGALTEGAEGGAIGAAGGGLAGLAISRLAGKSGKSASAMKREETLGTKVGDLLDDMRNKDPEVAQVELDDFVASGAATDDELGDIIYAWAEREHVKGNRFLMKAAEGVEAKRLKQLKKEGVDIHADDFDPRDVRYAEATSDLPPVMGVSPVSIAKAQKHFASILPAEDVAAAAKKISRVVRKRGGFKFTEDVAELARMDRVFQTPGPHKMNSIGPIDKWYRQNFLPISENLSSLISPKVGAYWERGLERTMRNNANFTDNFMAPMKGAIEIVNERPELKNLLLDTWAKPENLGIFRSRLLDIDPDAAAAFDRWYAYSSQRNDMARKNLFKSVPDSQKKKHLKEMVDWDEVFLHAEVRGARESGTLTGGSSRVAGSMRQDALRNRTRKLTADMEPEELANYENPLLSHSNYIQDQEQLLELGKRFGLRPSLARDSSSSKFFESIENRLLSDGFEPEAAKEAAATMHEAFLGGQKAPAAPVQAFMNLAYAGTLGQFKSAMLNLHDASVSAVNSGEKNTLKAVQTTMREEFGKGVKDMMGVQNYGEFVRQSSKLADDPSLLAKIGRGTKVFSDGAMFYSGFQTMDEVGKGVVLRSAVNQARQAAEEGTLRRTFGHLFMDEELAIIQPWLQKGTNVKDMPAEVASLIEDLAFAKLGEQQLISAAGRPMGYMKNPNLRPLYAMSGFAIKQQALLRKNVWDAARQGRPKDAAFYAAKYAVYAGLGYGIINETRNALFKGEEFDPVNIPFGAFDQVAAALTLNRLGDDFSRNLFMGDPVGTILESFNPPTGYNGAIGKAIAGDFEDIVYRFPAAGDLIKRMAKDDE